MRMARFLRMERGMEDDDFLSLRDLNQLECASCAACCTGLDTVSCGHILCCTLPSSGVTNVGWCRRQGGPGDWTRSTTCGKVKLHNEQPCPPLRYGWICVWQLVWRRHHGGPRCWRGRRQSTLHRVAQECNCSMLWQSAYPHCRTVLTPMPGPSARLQL